MFILLANQRSGTNLLRGILNSSPKIAAIPEIFHDRYFAFKKLPEFTYFVEFLRNKLEMHPNLGLPANRPHIVDEYFNWIAQSTISMQLTAICDIKYNSLHHADGHWQNPIGPPMMLQIIKRREMPIIHLRRRDQLAMAISLFRANISKQYVVNDDQQVENLTFTIETNSLRDQLNVQQKQEESILRWISNLKLDVHEVFYEDLFIDGLGSDLAPNTFRQTLEFLGHDLHEIDLVPKTQRTGAVGYRNELENFNEIEIALRGTPYYASLLN